MAAENSGNFTTDANRVTNFKLKASAIEWNDFGEIFHSSPRPRSQSLLAAFISVILTITTVHSGIGYR